MKRIEYIDTLKRHLQSLPQDELDEIINDLNEHFDFAQEEGKSEEEICTLLGSPIEMAKQFVPEEEKKTHTRDESFQYVNESSELNSTLRIIIGIFASVLLIGPVIGLYATLFTMCIVGLVLILCSVITVFGFFMTLITGISFFNILLLALGIAMIGVAVTWLSWYALLAFHRLVMRLIRLAFRTKSGGHYYAS
ncbi:MAG: DUF1700 domain-containing protein [Erysipelothrix sp.]